jgi:alpha-N-acetylglucosamine transferase
MALSLRNFSPSSKTGGRRNCMGLYCILAAVLIFLLFVYTPLPGVYDSRRDSLVQHVQQVADAATGSAKSALHPHAAPSLENTKSKYAFATLLASDSAHPKDPNNLHDDYFVATRLLGYQLMHATETRSANIPFIVLATHGVSQNKIDRLRLDGAIVLVVDTVEKPAWLADTAGASNWQEVFDKLRLWELTQFDLICFLDGDTVLNRPLDGVFADPAAQQHTTLARPDKLKPDEGPLPATYVFAGQPEMQPTHHYPPSDSTSDYPNINYLNAGFFVTAPSLELQSHYLSILTIPDRFVPHLPEQNLLNYAHRREAEGGNMPWKMLGNEWNVHYPTVGDLEGGVASLHEKWWAPGDKELEPYLKSWRWRMEGFYEALDELK